MNKLIYIFLILISCTGCRTIKDIQLNKAKSVTSIQSDSVITDKGVEYIEIERTYYFNDVSGDSLYDALNPSKITETIKTLKKADIKVEVKKDLKKKEVATDKDVKVDRQTGKLSFSMVIALVLVVLIWVYFKSRK